MAQNDAPKLLPSQPGDPVPDIRRIYDSRQGIGFIVFPACPMISAAAQLQMIALFLRRTDTGALGKPFMLDLVMN